MVRNQTMEIYWSQQLFEDGADIWYLLQLCQKLSSKKLVFSVGPWICEAIVPLNIPTINIDWHVHVQIIVEVHEQTDTSKLVCLLGPVLSGGAAAHCGGGSQATMRSANSRCEENGWRTSWLDSSPKSINSNGVRRQPKGKGANQAIGTESNGCIEQGYLKFRFILT